MVNKFLEDLTKSIVECDEPEKTIMIARRALDAGAKPLDIVDAVSKGLNIVGDLYEKREYFLMELTLAGSTAAEIMNMIKPEFGESGMPVTGKVVIGTVFGDLHYIGKDIVIAMLESRGFSVTDLGVDVPTDRFLTAVKEIKPDVVAMSGLLTIVVEEMKKVIDALKREGLRGSVKVMIGGRAVSQEYADEIGADAFGANAVDAVRLAVRWVGGE
ncbi:MAG: B12-binding domain-containing protein [Candidatus Bathyarchaeia archaeon]